MKNLIVGLCMLLLLMIFPLQSILDIVNKHKMDRFDAIVYRATQIARTEGRFTEDNIQDLKNNILACFPDITESEIVIDVTTTPKYRTNEFDEREVIYYKIGVPIKKIIAANRFLGIPDSDNSALYIKEGYVLSEVLP